MKHRPLVFRPRDADNSSEGSSSSRGNSVEGECKTETQKRTRAQRKRIRKKKLREDVRRRGNIIGPLPPQVEQEGPPGVRQNAAENPVGVNINLGEALLKSSKFINKSRKFIN